MLRTGRVALAVACASARTVAALLIIAWPATARGAAVKDHLYGVKAFSATDAIAVGNFGSIYRTADAGRTWEGRESGTRLSLLGVDFADARTGWAVGKSAVIVATTDGGGSWKLQHSPIPAEKHLFKIAAVDARTAWAVGDWGAITTTRDGGATWEDRSLGTIEVRQPAGEPPMPTDVILYDVTFVDPQHGYISGEFGTVLATTDGGATWERRSTGSEKTLFGIAFASAERGWVVGMDGLVLRTTDGGRTWTQQRGRGADERLEDVGFMETLKNPGLYAVKVSGDHGIVVGDTGVLLTTRDGGGTWTQLELPAKDRLVWVRDVSLVPGARGFAVGASGFSARVDKDQVLLPQGGQAATRAP